MKNRDTGNPRFYALPLIIRPRDMLDMMQSITIGMAGKRLHYCGPAAGNSSRRFPLSSALPQPCPGGRTCGIDLDQSGFLLASIIFCTPLPRRARLYAPSQALFCSMVRVCVTWMAAVYIFGGSAALIAFLWLFDANDARANASRDIFTAVLPVATGIVTYWFANRFGFAKPE